MTDTIDPVTGEFVTSPRESRRDRRARVRATEASRRGRRSQRKGRKGDLRTLHDLQAVLLAAGWDPMLVEDRRSKEAANITTGLDQIAHVPEWGLAVQTKWEIRPSIRAAWAEVLGGMSSVTADYVPACRLEWSASRNPHLNLAVIRPCFLARLAEPATLYLKTVRGIKPRLGVHWRDHVATHQSGFMAVLRLEMPGMEPVLVLDWADFLTLYRQAVTR